MLRLLISCVPFTLLSCMAQQVDSIDYIPSELPIRIDLLTDQEKQIIKDGYASDTSSFLIQSRPILFQIQGVKNNQNQTRQTRRFYQDVEVLIYCLGEVKDNSLVDFGWIENSKGDTIWKMSLDNSEYAGGDHCNRKSIQKVQLPPGSYTLHYNSNDSHASDHWIGKMPEHEYYYGITVFNLKAIEKIKAKLQKATLIIQDSSGN